MLTSSKLRELINRLAPAIESSGLDFPHVHFDLVDTETLGAIAAYSGMPTRFAHWSFGKAFHQMKTSHDYRLTQIYELVINNRPAYAFLDRNTNPAQALLVVAHVAAHVDFFAHNRLFWTTPQEMVAKMALHKRKFEHWRQLYGVERVESLIDAAMVLMDFAGEAPRIPLMGQSSDDILGHIILHAPCLEEWEKDALGMLHAEARYFWPQQLSKIANEGYATFWHQHLLQQVDLTAEESWEISRLHAKVVETHPPQLNPYRLGAAIYKSLWQAGGWDAVWRARNEFDDVGLIRAGLTENILSQAGLALYRPAESQPEPRQAPFALIKSQLLRDLENAGIPHLTVDRARCTTELVLQHRHDGRDLDFALLPFALQMIAQRLWKGKVTVYTMRNRMGRTVSHDGDHWMDSATG